MQIKHNDAKLIEEAHAFDCHIDELVANGQIPDLRLCTPCDWFYNNPWRRPAYVQIDFGEQFEIIRDAIRSNLPKFVRAPAVLDVWHASDLALARDNFELAKCQRASRAGQSNRTMEK
jgi:hypothetical protein